MTTPVPPPKPTKAKFVAGIKAHIASTYPGSTVAKVPAGYAVHIPPVGNAPDFVVQVLDTADLHKIAAKMQAAAAAKAQAARNKQIAAQQKASAARAKQARKPPKKR